MACRAVFLNEAIIGATIPSTGDAALFAYDVGATLADGTTAAERRVGIF